MIICHDAQLADVPLEQVPAADLTCNEPNFELEEDRYGPLVNWNGSNADEPPFSTYTLYYSKVMNIGKFTKFVIFTNYVTRLQQTRARKWRTKLN